MDSLRENWPHVVAGIPTFVAFYVGARRVHGRSVMEHFTVAVTVYSGILAALCIIWMTFLKSLPFTPGWKEYVLLVIAALVILLVTAIHGFHGTWVADKCRRLLETYVIGPENLTPVHPLVAPTRGLFAALNRLEEKSQSAIDAAHELFARNDQMVLVLVARLQIGDPFATELKKLSEACRGSFGAQGDCATKRVACRVALENYRGALEGLIVTVRPEDLRMLAASNHGQSLVKPSPPLT